MSEIECPDLRYGDYVKMWCPWCDSELWLQFLSYDNSEEISPGFRYFHPKIGTTSCWYLSNILAVMRGNEVIWKREE